MFRKWQTLRKRSKGFTLIELMIVVAIIAILAAIAIPQYKKFQLKSKTAEAKTNIGAIVTAEEAFASEYDWYVDCNANPAAVGKGGKQAWVITDPPAGAGWEEIGFQPNGNVYYQYQVVTSHNATAPGGNIVPTIPNAKGGDDMCVGAIADLDNDGRNGEFGYATNNANAAAIPVTKANNAVAVTVAGQVQNLTPGEF